MGLADPNMPRFVCKDTAGLRLFLNLDKTNKRQPQGAIKDMKEIIDRLDD
jgi:hypothetical protein